MTTANEVFVQVTRYAVCSLPLEDPRAWHFTITVEWRGGERWAVCLMGECLGVDGAWDIEPSSSNRDDTWIDAHRFDLDTALDRAKEAAHELAREVR